MNKQEILEAVGQAELVPLLAALAGYTGETEKFLHWVRLSPVRIGATIPPQGGLNEAEISYARQLCSSALQEILEHMPEPQGPFKADINEVLDWFTAGTTGNNSELLLNEILPEATPSPAVDSLQSGGRKSAVIVGAGLSGLAVAHELRKAGFAYTIIEKNPDVGGTWWENVYPGCRLDTPNHAYAYSFNQKPDWPDYFSRQPEILKYIQDFAAVSDLRKSIQFGTEVISAKFDEDESRWEVTCRRKDDTFEIFSADIFVSATGQLNRPNVPEFPGQDLFEGKQFHSAEWPADADLAGKKVAMVGSGASAFQIGPAIAGEVSHLSIFQRNAPWLLPTAEYTNEYHPGHLALFRAFNSYSRWYRLWQFWISTEGRLPLVEVDKGWREEGSISKPNALFRTDLLKHLERQYEGRPDLLAKMTPSYPPGAKRMLRDNGDWAKTIRRDSVDLVADEMIARIDKTGIWTVSASGEERHRELDAIIYATGFKAQDFLHPMEVTGRNGVTLGNHWDGDAKAYATMMVPNFPNMFIMLGPNSGLAANGSVIFMSECQANYIRESMELLEALELRSVEVTVDAYDSFAAAMDEANSMRAWGVPGVSTWYQNSKGRVSQNWPLELSDYWNLTRTPNLDHLTFEAEDVDCVRKAS